MPSQRITQPITKRTEASPCLGTARHSPGRVRGRYEEVDGHAVEHVQAMLHRPGAEKAHYGLAGPATWLPTAGEGLALG